MQSVGTPPGQPREPVFSCSSCGEELLPHPGVSAGAGTQKMGLWGPSGSPWGRAQELTEEWSAGEVTLSKWR